MDENVKTHFESMVDDLVNNEHDQELADGIRWLDEQAYLTGVTFYDKVMEVLVKHDIRKKAELWLKNKSN